MDLRQEKCPKCGRKGLHHPDHPHAYGWKDNSRARCRFCKATFRIKESISVAAASGDTEFEWGGEDCYGAQ